MITSSNRPVAPRFSAPRAVRAALVLALLAGCATAVAAPIKRGSDKPGAERPAKPITPAQAAPAVQANARFSADLLRLLAKGEGNVFFSPWSITTALDMARFGAEGPALAALTSGLRLPGTPEAEASLVALRGAIAAPAGDLPKDAFTLVEANRLWTSRGGQPVLPSYVTGLRSRFGADQESADFSNKQAAAAAVNDWVKQQTRGLIPVLLDPANIPDDGLILTNAVYFMGRWETEFREWATRPRPFTFSDGTTAEVPTMMQQGQLLHGSIPDAQVVALNYLGPARAVFILPDEGKMDAVVQRLDMAAVRGSMTSKLVELYAPKVDIKTRMSVADQMKSMGMSAAFEDSARFPKMTPGGEMKIADVIHAAALKMDEKKTEAAGATGVVVAPTSAPPPRDPPKPVIVRLDRPYLVVITHEPTGAVLFAGRVNDPRR